MRTQSSDTSPEAERVQIALIRQAPVSKRFALVRSLSRVLIDANRQRMRQDHPDLSEKEIALIFVAHNYGQALADRLHAWLEKRHE